MLSTSLTDLANMYGSDKGTVGPSDEWGAHNYTDVYGAYFDRIRNVPITILEIGLGVKGDKWDARIVHGRNAGGASIRMWKDYFPNARIYGIDINPCSYLDDERVQTFVVDQGDVDSIRRFVTGIRDVHFDVIIDDGSHRPDHQQISLGHLFRSLKSGGLYFIEDLDNNGVNDGKRATAPVWNTRELLKHFVATGEFAEPNALTDQQYLAQNISSLNFHVPRQSVSTALRRSLRRPIQYIIKYKVREELLCAIRKN